MKKDRKWIWSKECETAFQNIKNYPLVDLLLAHFDPKKEIIVSSDSCNYGIRVVILYESKDGTTKPIAQVSRTLLPEERNYNQTVKESLAIIYVIKKFHWFIHGRKFTLLKDHRPLFSIFGSKKSIPTHTANSLQRWGIILLNYNFKMEFLSWKKLGLVDGLLRLILKFSEPLRYGDSCLKGWKGIIGIVMQYNSGVICNSRRYLKKSS